VLKSIVEVLCAVVAPLELRETRHGRLKSFTSGVNMLTYPPPPSTAGVEKVARCSPGDTRLTEIPEPSISEAAFDDVPVLMCPHASQDGTGLGVLENDDEDEYAIRTPLLQD
jgi:hypothetical protein